MPVIFGLDILRTNKVTAAAKFTNEITEWEDHFTELKSRRTPFTNMKKRIEETLFAAANASKVLGWIKKDDDPELGLDDIRLKVTSDGRYENSMQWFFDGAEFQAWSNRLQIMKRQHPTASKRTLWINGTYGTGKTTLVFVTPPAARFVLTLQQLPRSFYFAETVKKSVAR